MAEENLHQKVSGPSFCVPAHYMHKPAVEHAGSSRSDDVGRRSGGEPRLFW